MIHLLVSRKLDPKLNLDKSLCKEIVVQSPLLQ